MLHYKDESSVACRLQTTVPVPMFPVTVLSKGHKNFSVKGLYPVYRRFALWEL